MHETKAKKPVCRGRVRQDSTNGTLWTRPTVATVTRPLGARGMGVGDREEPAAPTSGAMKLLSVRLCADTGLRTSAQRPRMH